MAALGLVLPLYKAEPFLPDLLRTVASCATWLDEVVVVEDGVSAFSPKVVEFVNGLDALGIPVRSAFHDKADPNATYNLGVELTSADYVWILDQDDSPSPGLAEFFQGAMRDTHYPVILAAQVRLDNRTLRFVSSFIKFIIVGLHWRRRTLADQAIRIKETVPIIGPLSTRSCIVYPRSSLLEHPFPCPFYDGSDIVHLQKLRRSTESILLRKGFVTYRLHENAATFKLRAGDQMGRRNNFRDLPWLVRKEHLLRSFLFERLRRQARLRGDMK